MVEVNPYDPPTELSAAIFSSEPGDGTQSRLCWVVPTVIAVVIFLALPLGGNISLFCVVGGLAGLAYGIFATIHAFKRAWPQRKGWGTAVGGVAANIVLLLLFSAAMATAVAEFQRRHRQTVHQERENLDQSSEMSNRADGESGRSGDNGK